MTVDGGIWQTLGPQNPALRACEFKSHSTDTVSLKVLGCYGTDLNKNQTIYRDSHWVWLDVGSDPLYPTSSSGV